jgi:hypothetical protein
MKNINNKIVKGILFYIILSCSFLLKAHNSWGVKTIYDYFSYFKVINTIIAILVFIVFRFLIVRKNIKFKLYYFILFFLSSWFLSYLLLILSQNYVLLLTQYFYIDKLVLVINGFVNITGNFLGSLIIYYIILRKDCGQLSKEKEG